MKYCGNCGQALENNARFCGGCGAVQEETNDEKTYYREKIPEKRKKGKIIAIVLVIVALIAVGVALFGLFYKNADGRNEIESTKEQAEITAKSAEEQEEKKQKSYINIQNIDMRMLSLERKKLKSLNMMKQVIFKSVYIVIWKEI